MITGRVHDDIFLRHGPPWHPENAQRLSAIMETLQQDGLWDRLTPITVTEAPLELIAAIHDPSYIEEVRLLAEVGGGDLDPDTVVTSDTWQAALCAAGGALEAVRAVLTGELQNAFCLLRPPGHHAMPDRGMGFCIFNSVAIAAQYALQHHGLERIAIVDFDVHHGNGTEASFVDRRDVLFASVHQQPLYPGTGALTDVGLGDGQGYTINCPLPPGASDPHVLRCFEEIIIPTIVELYRPQLILVSAGYDGYRGDPLAQFNLSTGCFHTLTSRLVAAAEAVCNGRIILMLEGGYSLDALGLCVENSVLALLGQQPLHPEPLVSDRHRLEAPDLESQVEQVLQFHRARMAN